VTTNTLETYALGDLSGRRPRLGALSLRRRLPLLIFMLLGVLGGAFGWMAYTEVQRALHASGAERINAAAKQIADVLAQSTAGRIAEARRLAAEDGLRQIAGGGAPSAGGEGPPAAQAFVTRNPQSAVVMYDGGGRLVGPLAAGKDAAAGQDRVFAATVPPAGVGPLRAQNGRVWYDTTVQVNAPGSDTAAAFLSIQRVLGSAQVATLFERLIGSGARMKLGNASRDVWTDLSVLTPAPPPAAVATATSYTAADGTRYVGVSVPVTGTPWLIWVEFSEATILGPSRTLLRRMIPITLVLIALGTLAVYTTSRRITQPLEGVARAAEAIAAGDYSRRVEVGRADELGRLAAAFNVMVSRVAEAHHDLEARVQTRTRELEDAQAELDRFFSLSLDLLCIATRDGRFHRVNPAWEQVLGWTAADLTSVPYLDLVHPDDRAATLREMENLARGQATLGLENRYQAKDGSFRWLSWKAVPHGDAGFVYAVAHDVTDQKRAERALHQHGADLATANRELESFSYSVSHDLRTPLRSIDGFAQALSEDYQDRLDETGRDYLRRIRAAAQRMGTLIDDLLSLSRVTRVELTRTRVDLSGLVADAAKRLGDQEPGRRVTWRIAPNLAVDADARLLRLAIDNLIDNAFKFTAKHDEAVIEFGVTTEPAGPAFFVRDNGAGFDMAHAARLFGAFQRLHGMTEFPGTGVGLATVQRIIRRHGGKIWADAAVGHGATFSFTLGAQ
jgi:PAS domain S-box-containing protein